MPVDLISLRDFVDRKALTRLCPISVKGDKVYQFALAQLSYHLSRQLYALLLVGDASGANSIDRLPWQFAPAADCKSAIPVSEGRLIRKTLDCFADTRCQKVLKLEIVRIRKWIATCA